jgi:two-component system sensor kinase FixL
MIVTDAKGLIQSFSPAAERAFGYTAHEVRGRNVALLMPSADRTRHDDYLDHYARTGERKIIGVGRIVTAARKNGETFPVELSVGQADSGSHRFFTGFIRDLTRQEADQLRLQELQAELLQISRLSAMGEMAAALAHELNQPLSAIANYLNVAQLLLRSENAGSEAIKPMGKAAEQTLRAGDIIRRLREFIAGGGPERSVESLSKVIQEAASLALTGARERGVRVEIAEDGAADRVLIDKVQVQQVVVNLVRNALEAMETSSRRELRITTRAHSEAFAQVTVADTGSGISETVASRLFQPFVTTKGGLGMGVGLSICRTIIEAQGGRIWTEPTPGGGAQFSFTLPRVMEEELVS